MHAPVLPNAVQASGPVCYTDHERNPALCMNKIYSLMLKGICLLQGCNNFHMIIMHSKQISGLMVADRLLL